MEIICVVKNQTRDEISTAEVSLRYDNETEVILNYNSQTHDYRAETGVILGDQVVLTVSAENCETYEKTEYVTSTSFVVILGQVGSLYIRMGSTAVPFIPYDGIYGIIPNDLEFNNYILTINLEKANDYKGQPLSSGYTFKDKSDVLEGKTEEERTAIFLNNLGVLRQSIHVKNAGPVFSIGGGLRIFTNQIDLTLKKGVGKPALQSLLSNHNLSIVSSERPGQFIVQAANTCGYEILDFIDVIYSSGKVSYIEPVIIGMANTSYVPGNFLWDGQYCHKLIETEEAWESLRTIKSVNHTFGVGDIVVAVLDDGLPAYSPITTASQVIPPSLTGNVVDKDGNSIPKILLLQDFAPFVNHHDNGTIRETPVGSGIFIKGEHGVNMAGIISSNATATTIPGSGTAGVAANTRLLGLIGHGLTDPKLADALVWAAGVEKYKNSTDEAAKLVKGFDVLASSIAYTYTSNYSNVTDPNNPDRLKLAIEKIQLYARNGRGALMVFSSGNDSLTTSYLQPAALGDSFENRFSSYPGIISAGATSLYPDDSQEKKAVYSNTGKIDFCAPSSNGSAAFRVTSGFDDIDESFIPVNTNTWTTAFMSNGDLPDNGIADRVVQVDLAMSSPVIDNNATFDNIYPGSPDQAQTITTAAVIAAATTITVMDATGIKAGMFVQITNISNQTKYTNQNLKISAVSGNTLTLDGSLPLLLGYPASSKIRGYGPNPFSTATNVLNPSATQITIASDRAFQPGCWIELTDSVDSSITELLKVNTVSGNILSLDSSNVIVNTYATGAVVKALISIAVSDTSQYHIADFVEVQTFEQGRTRIEGYGSNQDLRVRKIDGSNIVIDNFGAHRLDTSIPCIVRRSTKIADQVLAEPPGLNQNYTASGVPSANITSGLSTISVSNSLDFAIDTRINIVSTGPGGNSEWVQVTDNTGGVITTFDPIQFSHIAANTTLTGYVAVVITDPATGLVPGTELLIQNTTTSFTYIKIEAVLAGGYFAISGASSAPMPFSSFNVHRANKIQLDDASGFNNGDQVLLGRASYDKVNVSENSEPVKILKVEPSINCVFVDRINRPHLVGADTHLYKGSNNFTSSFGGTSSAGPAIAGTIALVLSANPDLTWRETIDILKKSSDKIDLNTTGYAGVATDTTGYPGDSNSMLTYSPSLNDPSRPLGQGRWKNKAGDFIFEMDGVTPTGVTDTDPYFSEWYGYGRVNTKNAVDLALNYSQANRDLAIRDTLADNGTSGNPTNIEINSPDIFVRNINPANETIDFELLDYLIYPPHQAPLKTKDRYVYARLKNVGTIDHSLEAKVRFFLVVDDPGTQFKFPDHFTQTGDILTGKGVKLLGEVVIPEGEIAPGETKVVSVLWPQLFSDVNTASETNILVEITPHDGPYFDTNNTGALLGDNNNITRKKIAFRDQIDIRGNGGQQLPTVINVPSNAIATPITTDFEVSISDLIPFLTESAKIKVTLEKFGTFEIVEYRFDSGSWGFDTVPTGGWLSLSPPLVEPYNPGDNAAGLVSDLLFKGSFVVDGTNNYVQFEVLYEDAGSNFVTKQKTVNVEVLYLPNPTTADDPVEKNILYFFTEFDLLNTTQTPVDAFGPDPANNETQFRTTSRHTASSNPKAFAVVTGQIMVQQTADSNLVNVILKPRHQGNIDFLNVKYFIYRGILKSQLIDAGNAELVAPVGTNAFVDSIWDTQNAINSAIENADPADTINPGDVTDQPSTRSLGYHFVTVATETWHIVKSDNDFIDELFFDAVSDFKFPIVNAGEQFGIFDMNNIGFEIILEGIDGNTTFGEVRGEENVITVPALTGSPTDLEELADRSARFKVLQYIDPAAFYGIHVYSGINAIDNSTGSDELYKENDAYDELLSPFVNKNRTYIDIRNENGYSFNYYDNYSEPVSGNEIKLSFDSAVLPSSQSFGTDLWPIRIVENSELEAGNNGSKNAFWVEFPKGDNTLPLLYSNFASMYTQFPKRPRQKKKFTEIEFDTTNIYSETYKFGLPNRDGLSTTTAIAWYVKMTYIRRNLTGNTASNSMVPNGIHTLDNVFPLIDIIPWEATANIKYLSGFHTRYIERQDFAFIGELGIAQETDRVYLFAVPEDVYFAPGKKTSLFKRILGGTSDRDSFFRVLDNILPGIETRKIALTISGIEKNCVTYNDPGLLTESDSDKRNFFCISMSKTEYDNLMASATSAMFDFDLHYPTLKVSSFTVAADDNQNAYIKYDLKIAGIDVNGIYIEAPLIVEAYSIDGIMITTHDFAFPELPTSLDNSCITFGGHEGDLNKATTTFGSVVKRLSIFSDIYATEIRSWQVYLSDGTPMTYGSGEETNFGDPLTSADPVILPVGTRVIMLDCKELPVLTADNINYVRIVTYYNGDFREGLVSALAFTNSVIERVLPTYGITDEEMIEALINDIRFDVVMARRIANDPTHAGYIPDSNYLNVLDRLEDELDPLNTLSAVRKYKDGDAALRNAWSSLMRNGAASIGLNYDFYVDPNKNEFRINSVATVEKYTNIIDSTIGRDTGGLPPMYPLSLIVPITVHWTGNAGHFITGYNEKITAFSSKNCPNILQDLAGWGGSSVSFSSGILAPYIDELKKMRSFLKGTIYDGLQILSGDPILDTPEAQWFLKPEHSTDMNQDGSNVDFFDTIGDLLFVWGHTWHNLQNEIGRFSDFRQGYVGIDCSMGFVNSSNVLAMILHELNNGNSAILKLADDTHTNETSVSSGIGNEKQYVPENAWDYVLANDFNTYEAHGFYPTAAFLDSEGNTLSSTYGAQKNIADFFVRNPSLGIVFADHIIAKLKAI